MQCLKPFSFHNPLLFPRPPFLNGFWMSYCAAAAGGRRGKGGKGGGKVLGKQRRTSLCSIASPKRRERCHKSFSPSRDRPPQSTHPPRRCDGGGGGGGGLFVCIGELERKEVATVAIARKGRAGKIYGSVTDITVIQYRYEA